MYRSAAAADEQNIINLQDAYLRGLYRGFAPQEIIDSMTGLHLDDLIYQWIRTGEFQVDVAEHKGNLRGFIVYGNGGEGGLGLIRDFGCMNDCDAQERWAIVEHSLHQLAAAGYREACMWVLVDNFRVRFLFESMGFRPDGNRRTETLGDETIYMARYTIQLNP